MSRLLQRPQFVILGSVVMSFNMSACYMAIPLLAKERLGAGPVLLGCYAFFLNAAYFALALGAGAISRRFGLRAMLSAGAVSCLACNAGMLVCPNKYLVFIPCLLYSVTAGLYWPAMEAANAEGQTPRQIKRGVGYFCYAWMAGSMAGFFFGGWLYNLTDPPAQALFGLNIALMVVLWRWTRSGALERIAPWRAAPREEEAVSASKRALFVQLGLLSNFGMYMGASCVRSLLPEYAHASGLTGFPYGLLMAALILGMVAGNSLLRAWHGWHYSGRILIGGQLVAVGALLWFSFTKSYAGLCLSQVVFGVAMALSYFSSIYYGMENREDKSEHGGQHEAVIAAGMGITPVFGGMLIAATAWPRSAFVAVAVLLFISALVQSGWMARARGRRPAPPVGIAQPVEAEAS